ncbi:hypothetical protein ZIOFF_069865 [Zingiber officinale]|uniref:Uncharacterized protein n=1 Tax=Zingiber officinale TaxID=94328 RepID=A0A8J5ES45_ZINOF|nr:hypothetical protein ZIOFF_069865 [Zingiber officinale]
MNSLVGDAYRDVRELCVFLLPAAASSFPPGKALAIHFQPPGHPFLFCGAIHPAHPSALLSLPWPDPSEEPPFLTLTLIPSISCSPLPRSASRSRTSPPCHPSLTPARRRRPSDSLLGLARTSSISCSPSTGLTEAGSSCPWISLTGGSRSSRSEPGRIPVTSKISPCDRQNKKERKKVCEVDILKKDPEAIREQIEKLERMSILIVLFFLD